MKNKLFLLIFTLCNLLATYASGEIPPAKVVFQQYMNQAQTFANNYPREKAYYILIIRVIMSVTQFGSKLMSPLPNSKLSA